MSPRTLLISFLTVAMAYTGCWLGWFGLALLAAWLFFPESFELLISAPLDASAVEAQVHVLMPPTLFWSVTAVHVVGCLAVGWWLIRGTSPWRLQHVVFVAMLLFVTYLQGAVGIAEGLRWMALVQMSVQPLAVLCGARWGWRGAEPA